MSFRDLADRHRDGMVSFAQRLIQTPSPSGEEGAVAKLIVAEMQSLGYDEVRVDEVGNVIGLLRGKGSGRSLMLNCHMDHVDPGDPANWPYPPYGGVLARGAIWGRGASDVKGALATQVYSAAAFREAGIALRGDVFVVAVVMEELGGAGTRFLMQRVRPDFAVLGESTGNQIARGHRGRVEAVLTVTGVPAHASAPDRAVNPHYVIARFLLALEQLALAEDPVFGSSSAAPTLYFTDQKSTNVLPGEAQLYIDYRNIPSEKTDEIVKKLQSLVDKSLIPGAQASISVPGVTMQTYTGAQVDMPAVFPSFALPTDHPLVSGAQEAVAKTLGRPANVFEWKFATDGGHLMEAGIPTIGFAPGDERLAHTTEDRIDVEMMLDAYAGYLAILERFCG